MQFFLKLPCRYIQLIRLMNKISLIQFLKDYFRLQILNPKATEELATILVVALVLVVAQKFIILESEVARFNFG